MAAIDTRPSHHTAGDRLGANGANVSKAAAGAALRGASVVDHALRAIEIFSAVPAKAGAVLTGAAIAAADGVAVACHALISLTAAEAVGAKRRGFTNATPGKDQLTRLA